MYEVRKALGRRLAEEWPLGESKEDAIVVPVPDSGSPSAVGFAARSGLPFEMGLIRSHYVGRTFIEPQQSIRHFGVRLKLSPNRAVLAGKRVVIVDDSIVRGTTSRKIVKMVRDAGAAEVHVRIACPPTRWPCYYGIDTPTRGELIAATCSVEQIRDYLGADSLGYLSLEGLIGAVAEVKARGKSGSEKRLPIAPSSAPLTREERAYCHACFSGDYPVPISREKTPSRPPKLVTA